MTELTREQSNKYWKQNVRNTLTGMSIIFVFCCGIGWTIYHAFDSGFFTAMAHFSITVVLVKQFTTMMKDINHEDKLIQERIKKRLKKNRKQGDAK